MRETDHPRGAGGPGAELAGLRRREKAMRRLVAAVQELSLARDLESVTGVVRRVARALTGADGATFVLRDGERCYYVDEDAISPLWKGKRFPMASCISGWVMLRGEAVAIEDIYADERIPADAYRPTFVRSLAMVPIRKSKPIGAIGNYWARRRLASADEIELLQALADSTSIALENVDLYANLERKVRDRTRELEEANRALESFASSLAHDLRGPARRVRSYADLLEDALGSGLPEDGRGWLARLQENASRMTGMVDDMLRLSGVGRAPLQRRDVDLAALARGLAAELREEDGRRTVEWVIPERLPARGDPALLGAALANLLGNAWKFTAKTPRARIELGVRKGEAGERVYCVRDNGAGFSTEGADRLFRPFQRLHHQAEFPGSGIGLATVKRIVEKHGGRIWAEGAPGQGAAFYFTL